MKTLELAGLLRGLMTAVPIAAVCSQPVPTLAVWLLAGQRVLGYGPRLAINPYSTHRHLTFSSAINQNIKPMENLDQDNEYPQPAKCQWNVKLNDGSAIADTGDTLDIDLGVVDSFFKDNTFLNSTISEVVIKFL